MRHAGNRTRRDHRSVRRSLRRDPDAAGHRSHRRSPRRARPAAVRAAGRAPPPSGRTLRRRDARLPARDGRDPRGRQLARCGARTGPDRPPGGDHRPDGQENDHQRPQFGGERLAGRLRGRQYPALGQHDHRPAQPQGRAGPDDRLHQRRGQGLRAAARRRAGHDRGPPARLAPGREAHPHRRRAGLRQPDRLRAVHGDQRAAAARGGQGTVLLPGQEREPPRGAAVERRVQPGPGRARHPARHHPGHRADRDDPGRVRDGGDPLRAAGALGRAERRALGLPVQHHQEVPHPGQGVRAAGAELGHHDRAVHARLHRAPGQDVPPARGARDRRHGRVHPEPARPRGQRAGHGQGAGRQDARVRRRVRRLLGGAPGPGAAVQGGLRRRPRGEPESARQAARGRSRRSPRTCSR